MNVVVTEHINFLFVVMNCKYWHQTNFMKYLLHLCTVSIWYLII